MRCVPRYIINELCFSAPPHTQPMIGFIRTASQVIFSASPFCAAAPGIYQKSRDYPVYTAS